MAGMEYSQIQEQKQILSQKMIQSAEILQMDVQELEMHIQREALENPLIDLEEMEKGISGALYGDGGQPEQDEFRRKLEWLNRTDEQNRVYYSEEYEEAEQRDPWNFAEEENDLQDYLMSQLMMQLKDKNDYDCMEFLVYSLDSRGYLTDDVKELAGKLRIDGETMEQYIRLLQSVEPAGVGARSLEECLQIQLQRMMDGGSFSQYDFDMLMELTGKHMGALGRRHFAQIAAQLEISTEDVLGYYQTIQKLNPIPGNSFSSREKMRYIKPDVTVVKFEDHFEVLVNDANLPQVKVSQHYLSMMHEDETGEVQDYLRNKYRQFQWLQQCIQDRTNTLLSVAKEIVACQQEFFEQPDGRRVPMGLRDIAAKLDIHESTVSRAVKNKFLQCAWGVYPMNYFFVRKAASDGGEGGMTPELVKQKIRELIDSENKKKPLSDQKLSDSLREMGIEVSRRTVAKYRSEMLIPDTTGRKEL
ncbi:MAG: RNA polymerase factor sigma-54 [Eubacteriales bacterium]|nr:RNA polymerase factor sigma-54 [Eubacteriales bacterium]